MSSNIFEEFCVSWTGPYSGEYLMPDSNRVPFPLQVLRNDVMSHVRTVESLNQAGQELLEAGPGDSPHGLQMQLEQLNERWEFVRCETERRQLELENNLGQVSGLIRAQRTGYGQHSLGTLGHVQTKCVL